MYLNVEFTCSTSCTNIPVLLVRCRNHGKIEILVPSWIAVSHKDIIFLFLELEKIRLNL